MVECHHTKASYAPRLKKTAGQQSIIEKATDVIVDANRGCQQKSKQLKMLYEISQLAN